jgi:hypothetical protein
MGNRIIAVSTERQRPAPRDSQTEYVSVLRPARRASCCCLILLLSASFSRLGCKDSHHPSAKIPTCPP